MITGFGNNVISSLAADITAGQTTIQVMPGTGAKFSGLLSSDYANASNPMQTYAKITLTDAKETVFEICHLTSVSNDILTVVRAQEGTTAKGWSLNDVIANFATRGSENGFVQIEQLQSGQYISGVAGGTANALTLDLPATYFVNGATDWTLRTPIVVYPTQNNTGASTLQLTMGGKVLGSFPLYKGNKTELAVNDILKDVGLLCIMEGGKGYFTILNPGGIYSSFVPIQRKVNGHALSQDIDVTSQDIFDGQAIYLGESADLNNYTTAGLYYQPANANAITGKNYPEPNAGSLEIYKHAGVTQIYRIYNTSRCYVRSWYVGVWSAWVMPYDKDNPPTPQEIGAVPTAGGNVGYLDNAEHYSTKSGVWPGGGAFQNQINDPRALFYSAGFTADGNMFLPIDKAVVQTKDKGYRASISYGVLTSGNADFPSACIHILSDLGNGTFRDSTWMFNPNTGTFSSSGGVTAVGDIFTQRNIYNDGIIQAGRGVYDTPGVRCYSPNNPPPQQDLSGYAPSQWVLANFAQRSTVGLAQSGWHRDWSTGLITQWGFTNNANNLQTINFPIPFPNNCFNIQSTPYTSGVVGTVTSVVLSFNNSSATFNASQPIPVFWEAIGY
ncbi:pyocin knob domain-containing protein [Cedecea sp. FDAARGOS_727]|uniref:pyocin knob domain-containing protein n=1 Tax=Cedecea sp. FDAARGOS_727 TaxID=2545798 RepID=UPI0020B17357|nr:hypothetical protein [Cedecea sp. FDAARGOS_727]